MLKNSLLVIPGAVGARGIGSFFKIFPAQIPRFACLRRQARNDKFRSVSAGSRPMPARHIPFRGSVPALCGLLLLLCLTSSASAREQRLRKFDAEIVVMPDGSVDVTENITFQFIG